MTGSIHTKVQSHIQHCSEIDNKHNIDNDRL